MTFHLPPVSCFIGVFQTLDWPYVPLGELSSWVGSFPAWNQSFERSTSIHGFFSKVFFHENHSTRGLSLWSKGSGLTFRAIFTKRGQKMPVFEVKRLVFDTKPGSYWMSFDHNQEIHISTKYWCRHARVAIVMWQIMIALLHSWINYSSSASFPWKPVLEVKSRECGVTLYDQWTIMKRARCAIMCHFIIVSACCSSLISSMYFPLVAYHSFAFS